MITTTQCLPRIIGYAAVYDREYWNDRHKHFERVASGAFDAVLARNPNVSCLYEHDPLSVVASIDDLTLWLYSDNVGMIALILPVGKVGELAVRSVRHKHRHMSWKGETEFRQVNGINRVEIIRVSKLEDISLTSNPMNRSTVVAVEGDPPRETFPGGLLRQRLLGCL